MLAQTVKHGDSNAMVMGKIPSTKVLINVHFKCNANLFLLNSYTLQNSIHKNYFVLLHINYIKYSITYGMWTKNKKIHCHIHHEY